MVRRGFLHTEAIQAFNRGRLKFEINENTKKLSRDCNPDLRAFSGRHWDWNHMNVISIRELVFPAYYIYIGIDIVRILEMNRIHLVLHNFKIPTPTPSRVPLCDL